MPREIKLNLNYLFIVLIFIVGCEKNYSSIEKFNNPSINHYSNETMLVIELKGNPNETAEIAYSMLYKAFYSLKRKYSLEYNSPLARWLTSIDLPREQWVGQYAIKLNQTVNSLPDDFFLKYNNLKLVQWKYGEVAEILHRGDYNQIYKSANLLKSYISDNGYIRTGNHEEIYIKGPGKFLKGNPEKYLTIIRYTVEKLH